MSSSGPGPVCCGMTILSDAERSHTSPSPTDQPATGGDYAVLRWLVARHLRGDPQRDDHDQRDPAADGATSRSPRSAAQWLSTAFMLTMAVVIPVTGWFLQRVTTRQRVRDWRWRVFCTGTLLAALAPVVPGAARRPGRPGQRHRGDDAAADDHADDGRARARPRPGDGQRHPGHVGRAGARPGRLRRDPAVAVLALDVRRRAADRRRASASLGLRRLRNVGEPRPARSTGSAWSPPRSASAASSTASARSARGDRAAVVAVAADRGRPRRRSACFVWRQLLAAAHRTRRCSTCAPSRIRTFAVSLLLMSVAFMAMLGSMILLPLYLQNVRGLSAAADRPAGDARRPGDGAARSARRPALRPVRRPACWSSPARSASSVALALLTQVGARPRRSG